MEVTRDNFGKAYTILENELQYADFIAIDAEFTGLSTIKQGRSGYDTLEELYSKTKVGTGQMLLIQYGISLFIWKEESNNYEAMPFTFYIFPQLYKGFGNDVIYTSQSSSINFLANCGFDFNKLFHNGISFMSLYEEEKAREKIEKDMGFSIHQQNLNTSNDYANESKIFIPEEQRELIDSICKTVTNFMKDEGCECVDLPICNPTQRKLIHEKLEENYPLGLYKECVTNENDEKFIRCHKTAASKTMLKKLQVERREDEERLLQEVVCFSNVIKLITKSKKPIIGHNMLLDLFLTVTNFFGPPPYCLRDFKGFVSNLFPVVFDTKVIAKSPPFNEILFSTSLGRLVDNIESEQLPNPKVIVSAKLKEETEYKSQYHQAGYDAYCTGLIFISLSKYISYSPHRLSDRIDLSCDSLKQYENCVYIMGIRDIFSTNLCRDDPIVNRKNVFYIRFPVSWKQSNIKDLFVPFCSLSYPINWINKESALVTITDEGCYGDILTNLILKTEREHDYFVLPYNDYINNKDPRKKENNLDECLPRKKRKVDEVDKEVILVE